MVTISVNFYYKISEISTGIRTLPAVRHIIPTILVDTYTITTRNSIGHFIPVRLLPIGVYVFERMTSSGSSWNNIHFAGNAFDRLHLAISLGGLVSTFNSGRNISYVAKSFFQSVFSTCSRVNKNVHSRFVFFVIRRAKKLITDVQVRGVSRNKERLKNTRRNVRVTVNKNKRVSLDIRAVCAWTKIK